MPLMSRTFIGWYATNLRSEAGKWKMSILAILCDTMKSTFKSIKALPASRGLCHSSTVRTTMTLSLPFRQQALCVGATVSARTKAVRSWTRRKKTCLNTAPTAPMRLIRSISELRSSLTEKYILLLLREFCSVGAWIFVQASETQVYLQVSQRVQPKIDNVIVKSFHKETFILFLQTEFCKTSHSLPFFLVNTSCKAVSLIVSLFAKYFLLKYMLYPLCFANKM